MSKEELNMMAKIEQEEMRLRTEALQRVAYCAQQSARMLIVMQEKPEAFDPTIAAESLGRRAGEMIAAHTLMCAWAELRRINPIASAPADDA